MALDCKREPFSSSDGCPRIDIDLEFPEFEACVDADPGKLKQVSKLDLNKSPVVPTFMPAADPLPIVFPEIEAIFDCPFVEDKTQYNVKFDPAKNPGASGKVVINRDPATCRVEDFSVTLDIPTGNGYIGTLKEIKAKVGENNVANPYDFKDNMLVVAVPVMSDNINGFLVTT